MAYEQIMLAVFLLAFLTSMLAAARLSKVPVRVRAGDEPRHAHRPGIPRLGGIAVFLSLLIAVPVALLLARASDYDVPKPPNLAAALLVGSAILFFVGLRDDVRGVRPVLKLAAQTVAAVIVYFAGFQINDVSFVSGYVIELGWLSLPVTVIWVVGVSNAFNLIDGLDGLAGGVAVIALPFIIITALHFNYVGLPLYGVALGGALCGFLKFNFPPARIFLGDSGSLVVGFLLAIFAARGATSAGGVTYALIPIFALSYPLLDTGVAILRRWLRGVPFSLADRRHMHHQLVGLGLSPRRALGAIYASSGGLGVLGLLAVFAPPDVTIAATMAAAAAFTAVIAGAIYWLQYHEFMEAGASLASAAQKARSVVRDKINARDMAKVICVAQTLEEIEAILADGADSFRFAHMELTDGPAQPWPRSHREPRQRQCPRLCRFEYPIPLGGSGTRDGLYLTIWTSVTSTLRAAGAERVAQILAPAIADCAQRLALVSPAAPAAPRLRHLAGSS